MSKFIKCILLLVLITVLCCGIAMADTVTSGNCGADGDNLTWTLDSNGLLTVSGTGAMNDYGYTDVPWFEYQSTIKSVILNSGVSSFMSCRQMTSISISDTVNSIGIGALNGTGLTSVLIPAGVSSIGERALSVNYNLAEILVADDNANFTSVDGILFTKDISELVAYPGARAGDYTVPDGVVRIRHSAFGWCKNITAITLPASVTTVERQAFQQCSAMASIVIPKSITVIPESAFSGCTSLTDIYYTGTAEQWNAIAIDNNNTPLINAEKHFNYAEIIASGTCGDNLTWSLNSNGVLTISGTGTMTDCEWGTSPWYDYHIFIQTIVIEDGITNIGECAFSDCRNLTGVSIADTVTDICDGAFDGCIKLTNIYIPASVTNMHLPFIFDNCDSLTAINVAESNPNYSSEDGILYNKDKTTLYLCPRGRTNATIHSGTLKINYYAFGYCRDLESITIPDTVTSLDVGAFQDCDTLTSVEIPASITNIDNSAFTACDSLMSITVAAGNTVLTSVDGILYTSNGTVLFLCPGGKTNVAIPNGVTAIAAAAFSGCVNLRNVSLPDGLTSIGMQAFGDCNSLTSFTFPEGVTEIPSEIFWGCENLSSVIIPNSVTTICDGVFYDCHNLYAINYKGTIEQWNAIEIDPVDNVVLNRATIHCTDGDIKGSSEEQSGERDSFTWTLDGNVLTIDGEYYCNDDMPENVLEAAETVIFGASIEGVNNLEDFVNATAFQMDAENIEYNSYDGVLFNYNNTILVGFPRGRSGVYTIPEGVEELGFNSFFGSRLESITLPESLVKIGSQAIYLCPNLEEIIIPANVTCIVNNGENFRYCLSFTDFHVDPANTTYEDRNGILYLKSSDTLYMYPFGRSDNSITLTATNVADAAFVSNQSVTEITFSDGVKQIGEGAFADSAVSTITLPVSIETIGEYAFGGSELTTVYYHGTEEQWAAITIGSENDQLMNATMHFNHVEIIASGTCGADGDNLTWTFDEEGTLTISGTGAMYNYNSDTIPWHSSCEAIRSIFVEDGVTSLSDFAFNGCRNVTSVSLPESITTMGSGAFQFCWKLTGFTIPSGVTILSNSLFQQCQALKSIVIPSGVTQIQIATFYNCQDLTSITIPASVTSIGTHAFIYCSSLTDVYYSGTEEQWNNIVIDEGNESLTDANIYYNYQPDPINPSGTCGDNLTWTLDSNGLLTIAGSGPMDNFEWSFNNPAPWGTYADSIENVVLESGVTSIGNYAFACCQSLNAVSLPDTLTSIGNDVFDQAVLSAINVDAGNTVYASQDGVLFNKDKSVLIMCPDNKHGTFVIPDGVARIADGAFLQSRLTEVTIPASVNNIGEYAFSQCTELESIAIPEGITQIPEGAFYCCYSLNEITIPASVTSIGGSAFEHCTSLTSVTIPDNVTSIGGFAFLNCNNLVSVTLPDGLTSIGDLAFSDTSLRNITTPTGIQTKTWTFYFFSDEAPRELLVKVDLPASVTEVDGSFWHTNLPAVNPDFRVPSGLQTIEAEAFSGSSASFVWLSDNTTTIGSKAFAECPNLQYVRIPDDCYSIAPDAFPKNTILLIPDNAYDLKEFAVTNGYTVIESYKGYGDG